MEFQVNHRKAGATLRGYLAGACVSLVLGVSPFVLSLIVGRPVWNAWRILLIALLCVSIFGLQAWYFGMRWSRERVVARVERLGISEDLVTLYFSGEGNELHFEKDRCAALRLRGKTVGITLFDGRSRKRWNIRSFMTNDPERMNQAIDNTCADRCVNAP